MRSAATSGTAGFNPGDEHDKLAGTGVDQAGHQAIIFSDRPMFCVPGSPGGTPLLDANSFVVIYKGEMQVRHHLHRPGIAECTDNYGR